MHAGYRLRFSHHPVSWVSVALDTPKPVNGRLHAFRPVQRKAEKAPRIAACCLIPISRPSSLRVFVQHFKCTNPNSAFIITVAWGVCYVPNANRAGGAGAGGQAHRMPAICGQAHGAVQSIPVPTGAQTGGRPPFLSRQTPAPPPFIILAGRTLRHGRPCVRIAPACQPEPPETERFSYISRNRAGKRTERSCLTQCGYWRVSGKRI